MSDIYLIGGSPCTGKSTFTKRLGKELGIPWISTDTIREFAQHFGSRERDPDLYLSHDITPEAYLIPRFPEQIAREQMLENITLWESIKDLIINHYPYDDLIIEGVAITPKFAWKYFRNGDGIKGAIFLINEGETTLKDVIYLRGLWSDTKKYSDDLKPKEIEWVKKYDRIIELEAEETGSKLIRVSDKENAYLAVKMLFMRM